MSDYIATLVLDPPLDDAAVRRLALHSCLDIHRVDWLRSYLSTDGGRMLCWYRARDAESVRFVLRQQGSVGAAVVPVATREAADEVCAGDVTIVELEPQDGDRQTSTQTTVAGALDRAGCRVAQTFVAQGMSGLVLVVHGNLAATASALERARLPPRRTWPCVEVDPRPAADIAQVAATAELPQRARARKAHPAGDYDVVVIGAGVGGICMLQRLLADGVRARVYESGSDVGGVWHWNRYPGARVDSESYTYGFSFSRELVDEWEWQELFAGQPEIERYLKHVVERFELHPHIQLGTRVLGTEWLEKKNLWEVTTATGEPVTARYLVAAVGSLSAAQLPDYPGIDDFSGEIHHTARWPAAGVDVSGRRVGVIGTGASGIQVIQTIVADVGHLTVFQRTPNYAIPQRNRPLTDDDRRKIRRDWESILNRCRDTYGGFVHGFDPRSGVAVSFKERERKFEELWQAPGFAFWLANFADLLMNEEVNEHAAGFVRRKIAARVDDPEVTRKLLPWYPFGAKRVPLENGYFEAYNRPHVRLVDLRESPIERVTLTGIRTATEDVPLDVIVLATGFDAGTGALTRIDIRGEHGVSIAEKWREGPSTYLGLLAGGFPNLFLINGPHNAAAFCNAGRCIEQNVDWVARCLAHMRSEGRTRIAPTAAAEEAWTRHVDDAADGGVLGKMKNSWFFGANTPGKPLRVTIYAPGAVAYRRHCEAVAQAGYAGCVIA